MGASSQKNRVEEPPYGDSDDPKLINVLKVRQVSVDDPNIVLYMRDLEESQGCYFAKSPDRSTTQMNKTLYVYLEGTLTMCPQAIFVDKFGVKYEVMEQRLVQSMTWQGFPIPDLASKTASSMGNDRVSHESNQTRNGK